MSDTSNNPVMVQPQGPISRTAAKGILRAISGMAGSAPTPGMRRSGKHNGRTKGAFGRNPFGRKP